MLGQVVEIFLLVTSKAVNATMFYFEGCGARVCVCGGWGLASDTCKGIYYRLVLAKNFK